MTESFGSISLHKRGHLTGAAALSKKGMHSAALSARESICGKPAVLSKADSGGVPPCPDCGLYHVGKKERAA